MNNDRLRQAFSEIHAEESLKENTKEYVLRKARQRKTVIVRNVLAASAACAALVFGGLKVFLTPSSVISIDVNPSIELGVNRFDKVVSVDGRNDDGSELAEKLNVRFENYVSAVDEVLQALGFSEDELVSITVVGVDEAKTGVMLEAVQGCASEYEQAHCYSAGFVELRGAHEEGLSCGKYRAFLELQRLDPAVTVEDVRNMTMREIQDRINTLTGSSNEGAGNNTSEPGKTEGSHKEAHHAGEQTSGQGAGHGNGHGHGHR